jgi:hypothetical protein
MARRCCTGVDRSAGFGGYVAAAEAKAARSGNPLVPVMRPIVVTGWVSKNSYNRVETVPHGWT